MLCALNKRVYLGTFFGLLVYEEYDFITTLDSRSQLCFDVFVTTASSF